MDPIPNDDDITKTQLWERIDVLRAASESHKGEILYRLDSVLESLNNSVKNLNSEHTLMVGHQLSQVQGWMTTYKLEAQKTLSEALKAIQDLFKAHLGDVEIRIKAVEDSIEYTVKNKAMDLFATNEKRLTDVEKKFEELSKGLNESFGNYQVESRGKVGELRTRIDEAINRLRDVFQGL